eukprot:SM001197S25464  [mRNA]  locus=s1197:132:2158:+ [translate_table: standard]
MFWPRGDAWEQLRAALDARPWIGRRRSVALLNQATDIINLSDAHDLTVAATIASLRSRSCSSWCVKTCRSATLSHTLPHTVENVARIHSDQLPLRYLSGEAIELVQLLGLVAIANGITTVVLRRRPMTEAAAPPPAAEEAPPPRIGVLAIQGSFREHLAALRRC